jgi:hypothetical protein
VSTVGVVPRIRSFHADLPGVNLALSLHAADQACLFSRLCGGFMVVLKMQWPPPFDQALRKTIMPAAVELGLGRIVALYYRSSPLYQIH